MDRQRRREGTPPGHRLSSLPACIHCPASNARPTIAAVRARRQCGSEDRWATSAGLCDMRGKPLHTAAWPLQPVLACIENAPKVLPILIRATGIARSWREREEYTFGSKAQRNTPTGICSEARKLPENLRFLWKEASGMQAYKQGETMSHGRHRHRHICDVIGRRSRTE